MDGVTMLLGLADVEVLPKLRKAVDGFAMTSRTESIDAEEWASTGLHYLRRIFTAR